MTKSRVFQIHDLKSTWGILNLFFFVIPTGLSHLPCQSKGHGVWLWASGNVVGHFSQILIRALDERMHMWSRFYWVADMLWMRRRSRVMPHLPEHHSDQNKAVLTGVCSSGIFLGALNFSSKSLPVPFLVGSLVLVLAGLSIRYLFLVYISCFVDS